VQAVVEQLTAAEIRTILEQNGTAVMILALAVFGGRHGFDANDKELAEKCGLVAAYLAHYELRKARFMSWSGDSGPSLDPHKPLGSFQFPDARKLPYTPISQPARTVLEMLKRGMRLADEAYVREKIAEAHQLGILPMDKADARNKLAADIFADLDVAPERALAMIEEFEDRELMGQNEDGSFWVRVPDGSRTVLIPGFYGERLRDIIN
jgi:hypothetical protein